jgi:tetratricopeptide (TPR) repeat protein
MNRPRFALLAALAASICLVDADPPPQDARSVGEQALKDRDWAKAEEQLTKALGEAKDGQDAILYMIATAQQHAAKHEAAIATLDRLVKDHPAGAMKLKALFKKGDVLAAKKEFALAAQIYDAQVATLTAAERRRKIAMVYVDAGREFITAKDPKDPTFAANWIAARNLLAKALELEALGADEEGVRADVIACELKGGVDRNQLLASVKAFEEKFAKSPKMDEVLFARGTAMRDIGWWWEAKKAWARVAADFPASPRAAEALYLSALLHVNEGGACAGLEELRRALPLLRKVGKDYASTEWGPKAAFLAGIALAQYELLREDARAELLAFSGAFPKDERAPEALLHVAMLHRSDIDDAKAVATYEDFLKRFPDSPRWPEVRQAIADVRFQGMERAFVRKDWAEARKLAEDFGVLHPTDGRAATASFRIGQTLKEEKKFREAVEAWMKSAAKFPGHNEGHQARYEACVVLATELDDFETAMKELPKVGAGWGGNAQTLLATLKNPAMALLSERVFTGAEAPAVKLTVRNVETVKFRLWQLDLKDYFEKKASTTGLEALEVSVIAPDAEWEVPVADYKRFKEMKLDVPLPKKDPGAYVVASSAGALESKTVVVVSDLAMIARAGRRGATVIVENMRTGERVENATVRTAADGKHLKAWTAESKASALSFLVESNGHLAFRDLNVAGMALPAERQAGALVLTDRKLYAAGSEVRGRLVVRDAKDGRFVAPSDKAYRLEARSAQGVAFWKADVTLSKSGTGEFSFRLLRHLPGGATIVVYEKAKPTEKAVGQTIVGIAGEAEREGGFDILAGDDPRWLGDDVDLPVALRDAWGRPLPGRRVEWKTGIDADWVETVTGPGGTFKVELRQTDRFHRDTLWIEARSDGAYSRLVVPLLSRGPRLEFDEASRAGEPLVPGDSKTMVFTAKKADDTPLAGTFQWKVRRQPATGERVAVASGDVTTDKDGKGTFQFAAKDGGVHLVTVSQRDADGIPFAAQAAVHAIDDKDEQMVRLLSGADAFEPGQPMEFTVLSRLDKGLAFVTVEGETVEQVVAVTLDKGRTTVKVGAPPAATRNFTVTVMAMQGSKFHADSRMFHAKLPEVKVEAEKKTVRPGEEAVVKVTARPGSEVWLAANADTFTTIDVGAFFPGLPGQVFTGDSSVATSFAWKTTELPQELLNALAELDELEKRSAGPMLRKDLARMKGDEAPAEADFAFDGEGGGGAYGGRLGGKKNLTGRGGGSGGSMRVYANPAPQLWAAAQADASGVATFRFRVPDDHGDTVVTAWAIDGTNAFATGSVTIRRRSPVETEFRLPATAVEGEKTAAVALLANVSGSEQEVTVSFGGAETKLKVPAGSILERTFEWTAAAKADVTVDGARRDLTCVLRPAGLSTVVTAGGAFTAKTELKVDGKGATRIRVATGPAALLDSLAEGGGDLTRASDAAARLIAKIARHRFEKTPATELSVMEFKALRAAGLSDAADLDAAWPVLVYLAAAEAKSAEFDIETDPALLKARFAQASTDDVKALILMALARGRQAEYGYIHRLWRGADGLSPRALACVALALQGTKKADEARDAVGRLAKAAKDDHWESAAAGSPDSAATAYATTALAAWALAEIEPGSVLLPRARAWLLARRPETAFERAALALAMQSTPDKGGVTEVKVDGIAVLGFAEVAATAGVVESTGAGTFYALAWRETGTAPEAAVKTTVKRTAGWPQLVVEGRLVTAHAVAAKDPVEYPSMAKVAAGNRFAVTYEVTVAGPTTQYAVLEFPQATGLRFPPDSLRLLLPPQSEAERKLTHVVWAYSDAPGAYADAEVLAAGADYRAGWQMTHAERCAAGAILFEKKKWKETRDTLLPVFEKGTLFDAAVIAAARALAYASIEVADHDTVVRYFEILKEKAPGEVIPFDKIRAVGRSYAARNEHERAMQVYSGTCDAYFLQEANVAGALEDLGRWKDAVSWMKTLLLEYPDSQLNRDMVFGFGQRLYTRGKSHRDPAEKDPKALTRAELLDESVAAFNRWQGWFPTAEEGDRVVLSLCSANLEAGRFDAADTAARSGVARFPKSRFLDTYDYTQAYALFAQKKFGEALVLCDRLESHDYGEKANPGPGVIRVQAVLMKAQIFHAKGELEKAIENYKKVKDKSDDAVRSIAFLEREAIAVSDVTVAPVAKAAELELEYAGVAEAQVRAYKVDLTMLALRRHNLADAASIEVAGIRPVFEKSFKLDHPNAKRREKQTLALDLKDAGAYLVGVKAGDFFASGIVLRSNLSMSVQEDPGGLVRVNVADVASGGFAEGVKVTIFGTDDQKIASSKTDLRGIWETGDVRGLAVVVAEREGHVAMYRGQAYLGMLEDKKQTRTKPPAKQPQQEQKELLEQEALDANEAVEDSYGRNIRNRQQGVEVERTKK